MESGTRDSQKILGTAHTRVEGPDKVTGRALYASDRPGSETTAHAALVTSTVARGRITGFDLGAAQRVPGVLGIFTHREFAGAVAPVKHLMAGGYANSSHRPLNSDAVAYAGQIVALVVAETQEAAEEAAGAVRVSYAEEPAAGGFDAPGAETVRLADLKAQHEDIVRGDAEAGWRDAAIRVAARYETPIQHHNPIELFTTRAAWDGDRLTVHEPTRYVGAAQHGLAVQLGLDPAQVRVVSGLIGGHFGSKFALSQHTALVALAARRLGRPVSLVPTRRQGFTIANYRPESRHAIRLGADRDGRFTALVHEAETVTSRFDPFVMEGAEVTASLYACPAIRTEERAVRVDRNTPGPMRAPPEVPFLFALESAVDEMAVALDMDPIVLRRLNDTAIDPVSGKPFSTRPLMACFDAGAQAFGWARRAPHPGTMRDGPWRVGLGCAASVRPVKIAAATLRVRLGPDGTAEVACAHHEIGNGITTLLAMGAAEGLGVPVERVTVRLGDTALPAAGISGGSSTTTSLMNALALGCGQIRETLAQAATGQGGRLAGRDPAALSLAAGRLSAPDGTGLALADAVGPAGVETLAEFVPAGGDREKALAGLRQGHIGLAFGGGGHAVSWGFGAQFAEVHVHAETGEIRVARLTGAFAAGRILNPLTAKSQLTGGMIWGLGSALLEETVLDGAAYRNPDLAEYLVPTSADAPEVEALLVPDPDDQVDALGLKGLGELGIIGVNAAIANAVHHATGRRIRKLPIRLEDVA
ncbi:MULTISPECIES: xanthine dehydrogenase family protein molybdopterin-binding subunit [Methylobacterium]|uniref:xanthine dehydrogenase family protein molybdopterin-binding subunit n=2 Tax=Methylobacteriaceae TaxID=119045 RepID=UPI0011CB8315|nr:MULTISPECIES: xanthine dehydrogenase family protein molybdopterin-binding subunit [Methylobacterium]TXN42326.1 xanthine dehydrogenase family protein molybdopterin-binding subunit [Methylobacterium sp. WL7]GJE20370.1 Aldehyde oxidoreductase molybdenum-binding subunit PaoC [Methylobacterium mesophilicum]